MASTKRLQEYLQEQQEPFMLQVYLAERGHCMIRCSSNFNASNGCGLLNSCKRMLRNPRQIDFSEKGSVGNIFIKYSISLKNILLSGINKQQFGGENRPVHHQVDYPPCDYDDGLSLHDQESLKNKNPEDDNKGILFTFLRKKLHRESEAEMMQRMECETQEMITSSSEHNKEVAKLIIKSADDLPKAWNLMEHRIVLNKCQEEKTGLWGVNEKVPSTRNHQKVFLETRRTSKKSRPKTTNNKEPAEAMIQNKMITMMSKKVVCPWTMLSNTDNDHFCNLGHVVDHALGDCRYCSMEECYKEIKRKIGDVILGEIVQEIILSSI